MVTYQTKLFKQHGFTTRTHFTGFTLLNRWIKLLIHMYVCMYPNNSRARINAWAQINTGVQHCKVNKRLCKIQKGLI